MSEIVSLSTWQSNFVGKGMTEERWTDWNYFLFKKTDADEVLLWGHTLHLVKVNEV